jgi:DNA repair protein RecO (recombination protein O)
MTDHRVTLQPACVLHHWPYRDTSLLLELFTPEHGRVGAVARGVRTEKSRRAGILQSFRKLLVSWSGRGELVTLGGVEEDGAALRLAGSSLLCGFYANELLMRLLPRNDPHAELYATYWSTLRQLADAREDACGALEAVLRIFEKDLLQQLGYGLQLDRTSDTGAPVQPHERYSYEIERGPVAYNERSMGVSVHGSTLAALSTGTLQEESSLRESKKLMRAVLAHYLGDKPLHSRELFQARPAGDQARIQR